MQSLLAIDQQADRFSSLLAELTTKSTIIEDDLKRIRHAFYQRAGIDRRGAAEIFHTNRNIRVHYDDWVEFYLEALTDFFLEYQKNRIVLPAGSEALLLAWLGEGVSVETLCERRLLLRILLKADHVSERFERRVFDAIKEGLLHQSTRWLGEGARPAGTIDQLDIQLIRKAVFGAGDYHANTISCEALRFLIDLDGQAKHFSEPFIWRSLMIEAASHHFCVRVRSHVETHPISEADTRARLTEMLHADVVCCLPDHLRSAILSETMLLMSASAS